MDWFVFAVLAPALWGFVNIIDKLIISKYIKEEYGYVFLFGLIYFFYAVLVSFFVPIKSIFPYNAIAVLTGIFAIFMSIFYTKSMKQEEASRVVTLFYIFPIFIVILSRIFLNEVLTVQKYIGIALIVLSVLLISWKRKNGRMSLSPILKFIIPLSILYALSDTVDRFLLGYMDFWSLFVWSGVGILLGRMSLLFMDDKRKQIVKTLSKISAKVLLLMVFNETMTLVGIVFFYIALSMQYVSIIGAIEALQPFFVLFYTVLLSLFMPKILREEVTRETVVPKLFAVVLVFAGTYLVVM